MSIVFIFGTLVLISILAYKVFDIDERLSKIQSHEKKSYKRELPPPDKIKKKLSINDIDKNFVFLSDLVESAIIEDWSFDIVNTGERYEISISNNKNGEDCIDIKTVIRFSNLSDCWLINYFIVSNNGNCIAYDIDDKYESYKIVMIFLIDLIEKKVDNENKELEKSYKEIMSKMSSKFLKLNRERKLKNILENDLVV